MRKIRRFLTATDGPTAVEYAVLLAMILMAVITSIAAVGTQTSGLWSTIQTGLSNAGVGS